MLTRFTELIISSMPWPVKMLKILTDTTSTYNIIINKETVNTEIWRHIYSSWSGTCFSKQRLWKRTILPLIALIQTVVIRARINLGRFVVGSSTLLSIQSKTVSLSAFFITMSSWSLSEISAIGSPVVGVVGTLSPPLVNSRSWGKHTRGSI